MDFERECFDICLETERDKCENVGKLVTLSDRIGNFLHQHDRIVK